VQAPCGSSLFTDPWMEGRIRIVPILKRGHAGSWKDPAWTVQYRDWPGFQQVPCQDRINRL